MADTTLINPSKEVIQAVGTLAMHALANATDPDEGMWLSCPDISVGPILNEIHIGGWKISVQRIARP